ncbi:hypothetical protein [Pseudomonas fluorescens]|uniref:hypothetical protein n=1 Tax=Pseudomonas fluorescens TaxID=294 RepID=UPI00069ABCBD|nr:hypothetical protein [Pseudomonas fluorescens]
MKHHFFLKFALRITTSGEQAETNIYHQKLQLARSVQGPLLHGDVKSVTPHISTGDTPDPLTQQTKTDIARIYSIWTSLFERSGSTEFLCGSFGIVDAMYAPVLLRLRRYGISIPAELQAYAHNAFNYPPVLKWIELAE